MKQTAPSALLIPIKLRASLSGKKPKKNIWSDFSYDFTRLGDPYAEIEKPLFSQADGPAPGVYLHWSLPPCFTQGIQDKYTKDISYRLAPNRWAVTRIWIPWDGETLKKVNVRTFLIESDVLSRGASGSFPTGPSWPTADDPSQPFRFLGRSFPMTEDPPPPEDHIRLTAVSPVSPFFAAYAPGCENVFSFYDDLPAEDLRQISLTYLVCGWYQEDGEPEPFKQVKSWPELKEAFSLTGDSPALPSRTLCHGLLDKIHWETEDTAYPSGVPGEEEPETAAEPPVIGAGNNSSEALAALMTGSNGGAAEKLMSLMLQNLENDLDRRQGLIKAEEELHHTKFGVSQTVIITGIRKKEDPNPAESPAPVQDLCPDFIKLLSDLRQKQRILRQDYAILLQKQRKIYENWYLHLYSDPPYDSMYSKAMTLSIQEANLHMEYIRQKDTEITAQKKLLVPPAGYELFDEKDEPFYVPTNPSLVLSQSVPVSAPLANREDRPLFCRVSGETVTGLVLSGIRQSASASQKSVEISGEELLPGLFLSPAVPEDLKGDIEALAGEAVLLSSGFSRFLAENVFLRAGIIPSGGELLHLMNRIEAAQNCGGKENPLFKGTLPDSCALTRFFPGWYPLIIEWQANYYPDKKLLSETPDLERWELTGGEFIYTCSQKPDPVIRPDNAYPVQGRLFISDHAQMTVQNLARRHFPGQDGLSAQIRESIRNTERLSQTMDGFNDALLMNEPDLPPALFLNDPKEQGILKLLSVLEGTRPSSRPVFDGLFSPIRGGFLSFSRLRIIDALGRFQDIFYPDLYAAENFLPPGAANPVQHLMLPPRLLQPARLAAWFLKAGKETGTENTFIEASFSQSASPVCGFLLPNLLDHSIVVYYPDGTPAGSLNLVETGHGIRWEGPPGKPRSSRLPEDLDPEMTAFLNELTAAGPKALQSLVVYINQFQPYTQSPGHTPEDIEYIGKPLAMVRLLTRLELFGNAEEYRHNLGGGIPDVTGRTNVKAALFPMEAGKLENPADGIAGFFEDGNYKHFHVYPELSGALTDPYFIPGNRVSLSPDSQVPGKILTLLLDPWSDATLTTGILPVKTLSVPRELTAGSLQNIEVTFFCSPILTDIEKTTVPIPHSDSKDFLWEAPALDGSWRAELLLYQDAEETGPDRGVLVSDGYIRIRNKAGEEDHHASAE